jgi:RHS repeat-associated protein
MRVLILGKGSVPYSERGRCLTRKGVGALLGKGSVPSFVVFGLNLLTNMLDGVGTTRYTYTAVSQILSEDGPWSDDTVTYGYTDQLRTSLSLQQPTGSWTNRFAYDAAKRLTNVTSQAGSFGYSYDPSRQMLPQAIALPNTSYISNTYDGNARLLTTTLYNSAGATLDAAEYGYNVGNQRTSFTNAAGTHVGYTYDSIGQLTVGTSSVNSENRGYAYAAAWNLNDRTNNGVNTTFGVNSLNELTSEGTASFHSDANGNLTNRTPVSGFAITNFFDAENRLIGVTTTSNAGIAHIPIETTFVYDGLGRLREQLWWTNSAGSGGGGGGSSPPPTGGGSNEWFLVGGIGYVYDGNRVIQERDLNNNPLVSYTRGNDLSGSFDGAGGIGGLLARSDGYSSGTFSEHDFYHADGNGNITYLVNSSQTLAASYRYDPFGNLISSSGSLAPTNTYRFSSKEFIPNVGIYCYLYRFYDPGLQRWLNRDPLGELGFEQIRGFGPLGWNNPWNLYVFVANGPSDFIDGFGLAHGGSYGNPIPECADGMTKHSACVFGCIAGWHLRIIPGPCGYWIPVVILDYGYQICDCDWVCHGGRYVLVKSSHCSKCIKLPSQENPPPVILPPL